MDRLLLGQKSGLYPMQVDHLVSFLEYTRYCTIEIVKDCTVEEMDYLVDEKSNSIGTLLKHIAALEYLFGSVTFKGQSLSPAEIEKWKGCYAGEFCNLKKDKPVSYYIALLQEQRNATLKNFKRKTSKWLLSPNGLVPGANNLFFWFHQAEDELCHAGQIKYMLKRMPANTTV